jgi:predicted RNase H-like nuclease
VLFSASRLDTSSDLAAPFEGRVPLVARTRAGSRCSARASACRPGSIAYDQSLGHVPSHSIAIVKVIGLDACRGRWLAIVLEDGRVVDSGYGTAATLIAKWPNALAIGVDVPIGLTEVPDRDADREARRVVGERRSSVFPTFPQAVLESPTYEEAKALCVTRGWSKPSIQSFGMRHRILEVAPLANTDERIIEVHPEVSFRELIGRSLSPKRTAAGASKRRAALASVGIEMPDLPYPLDDVLDAAVTAWSAHRYARGKALPLPESHPTRIGAIWR